MKFLSYYSRKDILKELVEIAKDREIQAWFDKIPGQRPDMIKQNKFIEFKNSFLEKYSSETNL